MFSKEELQRYSRQTGITGWGESAQEKLKKSKIFIAGAGGLGSPVLYYLAAAGAGKLTICDSDSVELSNLNRQIIHNNGRLGRPKAESAAESLSALNPEIDISALQVKISDDNAETLITGHDLVIDCLDNFKTRQVINRACVNLQKPLIHGGVAGFQGQIAVIIPPKTACLSCFLPLTDTEKTVYIAGPSAGVIGSIQCVEAIKYLTGTGTNIIHKIVFWDGLSMKMETVTVKKNPGCTVCAGKS